MSMIFQLDVPKGGYLFLFILLFICVKYFCHTFGTYVILKSRYVVLIYSYVRQQIVASIWVLTIWLVAVYQTIIHALCYIVDNVCFCSKSQLSAIHF
jgi:hypothetical protein